MMTRPTRILAVAAALAVAALAAAPVAAQPPSGAKTNPAKTYPSSQSQTFYCEENEDGSPDTSGKRISYTGPAVLWPPNHKYSTDADIVAFDPDDNASSSEMEDEFPMLGTEGTHDEIGEDGTEMNGAGNTSNDVDPAMATADDTSDSTDGSATTTHRVRSERSGRGDGRVYSLVAEVEWEDGSMCTNATDPFTIRVPHDMRPSNRV